uniref:uncharacterized protein n=1 Tax=Pristiophorus japonicus TaxID=55135 RepID=UPI00398F132B
MEVSEGPRPGDPLGPGPASGSRHRHPRPGGTGTGTGARQPGDTLHPAVGNCLGQGAGDSPGGVEVGGAPLRGERELGNIPQSQRTESNANLGLGNCLSQGENSSRGMEVSDAPLRGAQSHHTENNANLGVGNCLSQSSNSPTEGESGVSDIPQSHRTESNANLGVGNCLSQSSNSPTEGESGVSDIPQSHHTENNANLGVGNCLSQGSNSPTEGESGVSDIPQSPQIEDNTNLGVGNCLSQGSNSPTEGESGVSDIPQSPQIEDNTNLGVGNCLSQGENSSGGRSVADVPLRGEREVGRIPQSHRTESNANLGLGNCLSQGENSSRGMEVSDAPLRGAQSQLMENNTNLGVGNCLSQGSNSPTEGESGVSDIPQSHRTESNANLGVGNCLSQGSNSPTEGESGVSDIPQSPQIEDNTNLAVGNCLSQGENSSGGRSVADVPLRGEREVGHSPQSHHTENNANLGVGNCLSQGSPGEADQGERGVDNGPLRGGHPQQIANNASLRVDSCLSQGENSRGWSEVGDAPLRRAQSHLIENNANLGVGNCLSQGSNSPSKADQVERGVSNIPQSHQQENNANLGVDNCHAWGSPAPGEPQVNHTNLGVGNCLSQGGNSRGGKEVSNAPLRGGQTHLQENHAKLAVTNCLGQGHNSPGEADEGEMGVRNSTQSHQQDNNAHLGVGNCHSQNNNTPGELEVSNTPLREGQSHPQENHLNLEVGNCHSRGNNGLGEAELHHRGEMEVGNAPRRGGRSHQIENNANLGVGHCHSQGNNAPGEDKECSPGSRDHPCRREMEIDETQNGITINNQPGGTFETEEEIAQVQNGKRSRGGTGDCLLENEEAKDGPEGELMQDGAFVPGVERESGAEVGAKELAPEGGEHMAEKLESVARGETQQGTGKNGDEDVPAEESPERGKEEEISPELQVPGVNCAAKESPMEENCLETETLKEKGRRPKMSAVQTRDKFTQCVSTEARLQEVKIEALQNEEYASREEGSQETGSQGDCQTLQWTVVQKENKNTSGQAAEERDVDADKTNSKKVLDRESAADLQSDKEHRGTESDPGGPLHTAASTERLQMPTSPPADGSEHSAPPRIRLDMLSPLGVDVSHPLALSPSAPEQAEDFSSLSPSPDGRTRHGAKRVTFPSDETIVSGAVEPKDPWRHAQNVTVEEIIAAYKMACQKLNCKPINKLLKQIQEFKELSQRLDCLDLKGEKLDYKASEALEEVFKRVQFKLVDLEATNLDEDGASALFDMIEYYESATQLNISFNKHIGTRGWQAAAHMMRKTSCLQYLDARNTPLLDHSAPFVARALRISSSLVVLHLENASLSGRPLMLLATALKMNMTLRELFLADNKLNGLQDSAQLGNLLKFNCTIQLMDLRNNHILDSGLAYISDGLKEQRQGLVTLVLWNNQLTHNGMTYMAAALPYTLSLETLNLGHNAVGNEGVHKLKDGLIANRSVLRLGLASTKLTCEGAVAVAEFIADSPRLLRLDLRENEIKTGGLMALSLALKVNHSLLRLDLDREPKKETVKSFIETQKALLTEIQNGCKRNFILAKEKEEKDQKMQQSASMPEITVTLCENTEQPQSSQVGPKTKEMSEGSGNGAAPDSLLSVTEATEELCSAGESGVTPGSVECNAQPAAQAEVVRRAPRPSAVGTADSEKPQLQQQNPAETPSGKESVTDSDAGDVSSPATVGEQRSPTATELQPAGSESPVFVSLPIEIPSRSNERLVSSPGRGHKIFVVTRVESPPEVPNSQDTQWLKEALKSRKNRMSAQEAASSSEPLPCSASDTQTAVTVPASASVGSLQSGSPSDPDRWADNTGHDFETVCAKDCDHVVRGTALPNGLKAELVHRLPESTLLTAGRDGRAVSCSIEHEFTSPKTEKELEELLLEASQETCRETS